MNFYVFILFFQPYYENVLLDIFAITHERLSFILFNSCINHTTIPILKTRKRR